MKLRNLKMNESIAKEYEHALEDEHTILEPTEANALEVEKERKEIIKDDFKEQDKIADEVAKDTNATEVSEPKKVKDRKELSKLLAEAKEAGKQYKISRCSEEGYRYLFETIETEENKEMLTEAEEVETEVEETVIEDEIPETFEGKMDFLAADEQEAIEGYEKIISALGEEDAHVKEQLDKILVEEKAHKDFLEKVKEDRELVYTEPLEVEKEEVVVVEESLDSMDAREQDIQMIVCDLYSKYSNSSRRKIYDLVANLKHDFEDLGYDDLRAKADKAIADSTWMDYLDTGDVKALEECNKQSLEESDEPAAESIENCQKWVDYDIEHYGHVSKNTQEIIEEAGFQIIKDDHGDYEVAAGKYESLKEETNMEKINKALAKLGAEEVTEDLDEDDSFDLNSELYYALKDVVKKFLDKGINSRDLESAFDFCTIHMEDDEEIPDEFFKDPTWGKKEKEEVEKIDEIEVKEDTLPEVEEKLEEAKGKKYILYGMDDTATVIVKKEFINESGKVKDVKDLRDQLLAENEDIVDVFVARIDTDEDGNEVEVALDGYTVSKPGHKYSIFPEELEKPFEEDRSEIEIDDEFDWKY